MNGTKIRCDLEEVGVREALAAPGREPKAQLRERGALDLKITFGNSTQTRCLMGVLRQQDKFIAKIFSNLINFFNN